MSSPTQNISIAAQLGPAPDEHLAETTTHGEHGSESEVATSVSSNGLCSTGLLRLAGFLSLHLIMNLAQLFAMTFFAFLGNWGMCTFLIIPFTLSGILCALAAWHSQTPLLGRTGLPLSQHHILVGLFLTIPFGLFQLVIVVLELEDFRARTRSRRAADIGFCRRITDAFHGRQMWLDKFHCKAVNGALEGLFASAILLFGYWSLGFPATDPILVTPMHWQFSMYKSILRIILVVFFSSAGLCLLEIDFAVSPRVKEEMQRSLIYEFFHGLFRVAEIVSRCSLFIMFTVLTYKHITWWWLPLAGDTLLCLFLVDMYGGCEVTMLVRVICAIPCAFANVFFFIESPHKRRAARNLQIAFTFKNLIETVVLIVLCYLINPLLASDVKALLAKDPFSVCTAFLAHPVYWFVLWCMHARRATTDLERKKDIFTACEDGDVEHVMSLTNQAGFEIDLNAYDIDGKTPLMVTVQKCNRGMSSEREGQFAEVCRFLIEQEARIDLQIFEEQRLFWRLVYKPQRLRWTALHIAAHQGSFAIVTALVDAACNFGATYSSIGGPPFRDASGDTPLHIAVRQGYEDVARALVDEWPEWAQVKNRRGKTPLDLAESVNLRGVITHSNETSLLPDEATSNPVCSNSSPDLQRSQWVKLPIIRTFFEGKPCHAPGLSSFLACSGGGILGKVFLAPIPENDSLDASRGDTEACAVDIATYQEITLEDIAPIDINGVVSADWKSGIEAKRRRGQQLEVTDFQDIDKSCLLGSGSYGEVWRARDEKTARRFAVKNMEGQKPQLQREADMSKHIQLKPHPCIVEFYQIYDFHIGFYMLVMELCARGDLQCFIRKRRKEAKQGNIAYSPPDVASRWIGQVFLGLEHVHIQMKSLLRDMKPANLVISETNVAKLTDFGFGRLGTQTDGPWTFKAPPGSPGYIAPEVLVQQAADARSDLYSLGVTIWTLLSGGITEDDEPRPPFDRPKGRKDYGAHSGDWQKLKFCIEHPHDFGALPLPAYATDLVSDLVQPDMTRRPNHAAIRQYACMQQLDLPEVGSSKQKIEAWLSS